MKILLDTHVLLWTMQGAGISAEARRAIVSNTNIVLVSVVSLWELAIKSSLGKIKLPAEFFKKFPSRGFEILPITLSHIEISRKLPLHHRDPFDRMLVAQARGEQLLLVTRDQEIKKYGVSLLWA